MKRLAFNQLVETYGKQLFHYLKLSLPSEEDAKDVYQETLLSLWNSMDSFQKKSSEKTWVFSLGKRRVADFYRKQKVSEPLEEDLLSPSLDKEESLDLQELLTKLPKEERRLIFLIFQMEMTYEEIGELEHIPVGTVKSRFFTIKNKLRKEMEDHHG